MTKRRARLLAGLSFAATLVATAASAHEDRVCASAPGGSGPAQAAARAFLDSLAPIQRATAVRTYNKSAAIRWSNLPIALAPRVGVRLGDLNEAQTAAAKALLQSTLSSCGIELLDGVRAADGVLKPLDNRGIGWDPANYFVAFIGEPSADKPWSLKVDGHHIALNLTFNAAHVSATPLFDGIEPVEFKVGERAYEPLAPQAGAMRALATALSATPSAKLAGEFRDVTRGSTPDGDTNFPITYPQGATGRGVAYSALPPAQQALVRAAMARWVELPNGAISKPLMADYSTAAALAQTYVGVAGMADLSKPGSYVRIDGPRIWIEFIVQPAARDPAQIHYHTIWRDKLADYGGAFAR
ncbi:MAG: DUF3500 domain-containing protein [Phenylobacterium sp.]|uniref:DUF3500 domain-containing protein n=1 Tax=Phenylobacterium sp. TaxID=1871053 RepID=UPI001210D1EA|nr:DUF3500 domain-containing protein [Phenylobacterium sp.]TAL36355.1 MAG: DUF3500 domain-containing protein [Phenylobacterium sp.]